MRNLLGLMVLLFAGIGAAFGQTVFTPDYVGIPPQQTTFDSRINAIITGTMGSTTGGPPRDGFSVFPNRLIGANPGGVGDYGQGPNQPRAVGVPSDQIRDSNIVAKVWGNAYGRVIGHGGPQPAQHMQRSKPTR